MRHRFLGYFLFGIAAVVLVTGSADLAPAQSRIRIPRPAPGPRKSPLPPPAGSPQPATTDTGAAAAARPSSNDGAGPQVPAGIIIDDGYTFFTVRGKKDYVDGKPIDKGWSLVSSLRMAGPSIPKRSAFRVVVKRGGQALATTRCQGGIPAIPQNQSGPMTIPMIGYCYDDTQLVTGDGRFNVEVYYVNGDDDGERLARTYEIDVRRVARVRGTNTNPQPDVPEYYVSRHGEVLSNIIYLRPAGEPPYVVDTRPDTYGENRVEIVYSASTTEMGNGIGGSESFVRCSVDGQRVELKDDKIRNFRPSSRAYQVIHTDRLAPEFKRGREYNDEINFRQYYAVLPLTWGKQGVYQNFTKIEEHPGRWECTYREGADVVRVWRWTVGRDGSVAPHPEEAAAGVTLFPGAHLVETEIPAGGSAIDKRLFPEAAREGFLYGRRWQTPEGRAMAARVPAKGKPWPVPSTMR